MAAGSFSGHTPAVYLPVAGAGIEKGMDDLLGLWSPDSSGTRDQEGGSAKGKAALSLPATPSAPRDRDQGRMQLPEGRRKNWEWTLDYGGPSIADTSRTPRTEATCGLRFIHGIWSENPQPSFSCVDHLTAQAPTLRADSRALPCSQSHSCRRSWC